jgi:hypothetical protein
VLQASSRPLYKIKGAKGETRLDYEILLEDNDFTNMGFILKGNPANFYDTLLTPPALANLLTSQLTLRIVVSKPSLTFEVQQVLGTRRQRFTCLISTEQMEA